MPPSIILAGPTATGKSEIAVLLAEEFGGEIINADSMQVYRHFNIGTAKPDPELLRRAPHHLIDILEPQEEFNAYDFKMRALELIRRLNRENKMLIIAGGTGLYLKTLLRDNECAIEAAPEIRARVRAEILAQGAPALHAALQKVDPEYAARIQPTDPARIERALSVYYQSGRPLSSFHAEDAGRRPAFDYLYFVLDWKRDALYRNIDRRVDRMMERGLVEEARALLDRGINRSLKPFQGIGYTQALKHLDGAITRERAAYEIKLETRHYAKRQITWFKKVAEALRVEVDPAHKPRDVKNRILSMMPASAVALALLVWTACLPVRAAHADAELFRNAALLYRAGQLDEAESVFGKLRAFNAYSPEGKRSLYYQGKIAVARKRWDVAENYFKNALTENPLLEDYLLYEIALILGETGRPEEALALLGPLLTKFPDSRLTPQAEMLRADILTQSGKSAVAANLLEKLIAHIRAKNSNGNGLKSSLPDLLLKLARTLVAAEKKRAALEAYRELHIHYPAHAATVAANPEMESLAASISAPPLSVEQFETRLLNLITSVRYEDILKELDVYYKKQSGVRGRFYFLRAAAFNGLRRREQAIATLQDFLKKHPGHARTQEAHLLIGHHYWNLNRDEDALQHLQQTVKLNGKTAWAAKAHLYMGKLNENRRDFDQALVHYSALAGGTNNDAQKETAVWRIGWIHYLRGEFGKAAEQFANSARLFPKGDWIGESLFWLAKSAERNGDPALARESYQQLVQQWPLSYYSMRARENLQALDKSFASGNDWMRRSRKTSFIPAPSLRPGLLQAPPETALAAADQRHLERARELLELGWLDDAAYEIHRIEEKLKRTPATIVWLADAYGRARTYASSMRILQAYRNQVEKNNPYDIPQAFWERLYPLAYPDVIDPLAREQQVDPLFVRSIIQQESLFDAQALSPAGARGLMQIMPETGKRFASDKETFSAERLFDPNLNLVIGINYLRNLAGHYNNNPLHMLICYNAGPDPLQNWLERFKGVDDPDVFIEMIPYAETRNYVRRVMKNYEIYKALYPRSAAAAENNRTDNM